MFLVFTVVLFGAFAGGKSETATVEKSNLIIATGASKENIRLVGKGEAELAIVQNDVMDYAMKGIELFNSEKV